MTPLLAALSSSRDAVRRWVVAAWASPASAASRKRRTAVLSSLFTFLLRTRRRSFWPMRLIWLLMLATRDLPQVFGAVFLGWRTDRQGYQPVSSASQRKATSPWAAWNARTVGSPGGGGLSAPTTK